MQPDWLQRAIDEGRVHEGTTLGDAVSSILRADSAHRKPPGTHLAGIKINEEGFTQQVIAQGQADGWKVAHFRKARIKKKGKETWVTPVAGDGKGWPDLSLARPPRFFVVELKVPPNTTSPEQDAWLDTFRACGIPAFIWTPDDWPTILKVLE